MMSVGALVYTQIGEVVFTMARLAMATGVTGVVVEDTRVGAANRRSSTR